jgi:DnaK suppressor protein
MKTTAHTRFREQLLDQRAEILALADEHHIARAPIEVDDVPDFGDLAAQRAETLVSTSIAESEIRLLDKIDLALERIDEGNYGQCKNCEIKIPVARLRAKPTASLCLDCQNEKERQIEFRQKARAS